MSDYLELLNEFAGISVRSAEKTLLNLGGAGYYENPMSDLLAFFLNPDEEHGLGDLVLSCLLAELNVNHLQHSGSWASELQEAPIRERIERIDIVLHGPDWAIAVENKIRHQPSNPFESYRGAIENTFAHIRPERRAFAILSPYDPRIKGWVWVKTGDFLNSVREKSGPYFFRSTGSKWPGLLREFIITVEQELEAIMDDRTFSDLSDNYKKLVRIVEIHDEYIQETSRRLSEAISEILDPPPSVRIHNWRGWGRALRVYPSAERKDNITLLVRSVSGAPYRVIVYWSKPLNLDGFQGAGAEGNLTLYDAYYNDFSKATKSAANALREALYQAASAEGVDRGRSEGCDPAPSDASEAG